MNSHPVGSISVAPAAPNVRIAAIRSVSNGWRGNTGAAADALRLKSLLSLPPTRRGWRR
jgi:hypothetical protein